MNNRQASPEDAGGQDLTVEQVAELTGLEAAYLNAVEAGEEVPSIGAVIKISRASGPGWGTSYTPAAPAATSSASARPTRLQRWTAPRAAALGWAGVHVPESPLLRHPGQGMEPFLVTSTRVGFHRDAGHPRGEEFLYVLSGTLELLYDGETHVLKQGDSLYIDSSRPHACGRSARPPRRPWRSSTRSSERARALRLVRETPNAAVGSAPSGEDCVELSVDLGDDFAERGEESGDREACRLFGEALPRAPLHRATSHVSDQLADRGCDAARSASPLLKGEDAPSRLLARVVSMAPFLSRGALVEQSSSWGTPTPRIGSGAATL